MVVVAVVVLAGSLWGWWHVLRSDPEATLYGAIENSLRTPSVTRVIDQAANGQTFKQATAITVTPKPIVEGRINYTGPNSVVETETISSKNEEFTRYTVLRRTGEGQKELDYNGVLGVWGKTSSDETGQPSRLYGEAFLGALPTIGNMEPNARRNLMKMIRDNNTYQFDEKTLERKIVNGRPTYIYNITMPAIAYVKMVKEYGTYINRPGIESVDPEQYKDAEPLSFKMTVDVWGRHVTALEYPNNQGGETLGSYGVIRDVTLPKDFIPNEELQQKIQQAQQ